MHATAHAVQDQFDEARMELENLIAQLLSPPALRCKAARSSASSCKAGWRVEAQGTSGRRWWAKTGCDAPSGACTAVR